MLILPQENFQAFPTEEAPAIFGAAVLDERSKVNEPTVLQMTISHDGRITMRGPRAALVELMACCARNGFVIEFDYLNWCG
jgi:hypothetical protein